MNQIEGNRVLARLQARELTAEEMSAVSAAGSKSGCMSNSTSLPTGDVVINGDTDDVDVN